MVDLSSRDEERFMIDFTGILPESFIMRLRHIGAAIRFYPLKL